MITIVNQHRIFQTLIQLIPQDEIFSSTVHVSKAMLSMELNPSFTVLILLSC